MLHEFLDTHRTELISRCRAKVARRPASKASAAQLDHGIPVFLEQLIRALRAEQAAESLESRVDRTLRCVGGNTALADTSEIAVTAMQHGLDLSMQGFTIEQVVHDYGDLCQAVTELASETRTAIEVSEFRTLNRCLDDAIAGAVTEFSNQRDSELTEMNIQVSDERARVLLRELQSHVQAATHAITAVQSGNVGLKGATGAILGLSLISLRTLIERSLAVRAGPVGLLARH